MHSFHNFTLLDVICDIYAFISAIAPPPKGAPCPLAPPPCPLVTRPAYQTHKPSTARQFRRDNS